LAPVVTYQIGCDHIKIALRAFHPGPPGQQPDEGLGCDLVRGVVVIHQAPDPAGELGVNALEQLFGSVGVAPVNLTSGAHRISLDEVPGRRREQRAIAPRTASARHEYQVGAGRDVLENTRVIRQLLPHSYPATGIAVVCWSPWARCGSARARWGLLGCFESRPGRAPVTSGPPLRARAVPGLALLRRCNPLIGCTENFSRTGLVRAPAEVQAVGAGYTEKIVGRPTISPGSHLPEA